MKIFVISAAVLLVILLIIKIKENQKAEEERQKKERQLDVRKKEVYSNHPIMVETMKQIRACAQEVYEIAKKADNTANIGFYVKVYSKFVLVEYKGNRIYELSRLKRRHDLSKTVFSEMGYDCLSEKDCKLFAEVIAEKIPAALEQNKTVVEPVVKCYADDDEYDGNYYSIYVNFNQYRRELKPVY